jgi:hypothetical protein
MRRTLLTITLTLLIPQAAQAQLFQPVFIPNSMSGQMNQLITLQTLQRQNDAKPTPPKAEPTPGGLDFRQTPERTRANLAQFVAKSRTVDPQGAAAMQQLFASTDIIAAMGQELAKYGLRTDNVADCYAVWWVSAWQAANGDTSDITRPTAQATKAQAARAPLQRRLPRFRAARSGRKRT